jgi:hypothetical protein
MLNKCAPGHEKHLGRHKYTVTFASRTFPGLDSGGHDSKGEVQAAQLAKMVRFLKIDKDCASKMMPELEMYLRR